VGEAPPFVVVVLWGGLGVGFAMGDGTEAAAADATGHAGAELTWAGLWVLTCCSPFI
jgi:hypothetical protein